MARPTPETRARIAPEDLPPAPLDDAWLMEELRTDHAGETGAVAIYRGILAVSRDAEVRVFSERHRATERHHLDLMDRLVPPRHRSRLLPLWRLAGWLTGALPALFGARAVFVTIEAVETFVDAHYGAQIDRLTADARQPEIAAVLRQCREEEVFHRDDAAGRFDPPRAGLEQAWVGAVAAGSRAAVWLARKF